MTSKARFISVEGVEGVGKTTNIKVIQEFFARRNITTFLTREPGGTPLAEDIRALLLTSRTEQIQPMAELLMMFAARTQHVEQVIKPALARGEWVISDRFTDSSYAYQGAGRGLSIDRIRELELLVLGDFEPDLTILLDLPVEIGLQRAEDRGKLDRFELEESEFFSRVRKLFLDRAQQNPQRFRIIDTSQSLTNVKIAIEKELEKYLLSF